MDVASLIKECNNLGAPVDLTKVSKECFGWSPAQVLELRLEHLLLQRRLAMTEGRLKEMEGKVVRRNEEESSDGLPSSNPGTLKEESITVPQEKSLGGGGCSEMIQDAAESESKEEEDLEGSCAHLIIVNVTSIAEGTKGNWECEGLSDNVDLEMEDEDSSSSSDYTPTSEAQRSPMDKDGRSGPGTRQQETSTLAPGITPRRQFSSDLGCNPDRPSSTLANRSVSDMESMEISSGNDNDETPNGPDSGAPAVAVAKIGKRFACFHCAETFSSKNNLVVHRFRKHRSLLGVLKCEQCRLGYLCEGDLKRHNTRCHRPASESVIGHEYESLTTGSTGDVMEDVARSEREKEEELERSPPDIGIVITTSNGEGMNLGTPEVETSTPAPDITPRRRLISHSEHRHSPERPSSSRANHSDSDVEVSKKGEEEGPPPNSGGSTDAVSKTRKRFPCFHCSKTFNSNQSLERHRFGSHLNEAGVFPCDQCRQAYSSEWDLKRHNNRRHGNLGTRISCSHCPKTFQKNENLVSHRFRFHRNEPGVLRCDQCRRAFLFEQSLKRHNRRCHRPASERKTFNCKYCSKVFSSMSHCWKHQSLHDGTTGEVKELKCDLCPNTSFGTIDTLKRHNKRFHP